MSAGQVLSDVSTLAAGAERTCALVPLGVRCWGAGAVEAADPLGSAGAASHVAVGDAHVCAAFTAPRAVRCAAGGDTLDTGDRKALLPGAVVVGLTAGARHTCAVLEDGSVQCWGSNSDGQLGDGTTTESPLPVLVSALPKVTDVRAGANHTCARLRNNTVACWGSNNAHQLANGRSEASSRPEPVNGLLGVQELSLAGDSACARLADGSVRCWGGNASGHLGDGTMTAHDVPMPVRAAKPGPAPR